MPPRSRPQLEAFLVEQGVDLDDPALELELNSQGWEILSERATTQAWSVEIGCLVECAPDRPHTIHVTSDAGHPDRDSALMRALEQVIDLGVHPRPPSTQDS